MRPSSVLLVVLSCGPRTPARHVVLICDASTSTPEACSIPTLETATRYFISRNPSPGSTLSIQATGCAEDDLADLLDLQVPASWGPHVARARRQWQEEVLARLRRAPIPAARECSAVIEGAWAAGFCLRDYDPGTREIWIVSDGREATPAFGNWEEQVPWSARDLEHLVADRGFRNGLTGTAVTLCGVGTGRSSATSGWDAARAVALEDAWHVVFETMDALSVVIRGSCPWANAEMR